MNYKGVQVLQHFINQLPFREVKPGLERIQHLLDRVGNPQKKLRAVHVGGTNGKGSVVQLIAAVLQEAGFKVGVYTSPHLIDLRERIRINTELISESELMGLTEELRPIAEAMLDKPTQFEFLTALALLYFARKAVDLAVIEVGLGGRFDATNLIQPLVSAITNVEWDHMDLLGNSLEKIAWEKAGIIKEKTPIVTAEAKTESLKVIEAECAQKGADLFMADLKRVNEKDFNWDWQEFEIAKYGPVKLRLLGSFQRANLAMALKALELLNAQHALGISKSVLIKGLEKAYWPGRFEVIRKAPYIVLDGAHNSHAMMALKQDIERYAEKYLQNSKRWLLFGCMRDKEVEKLCEIIFPVFDEIILTKPEYYRACELDRLKAIATQLNVKTRCAVAVKEGFQYALERMGSHDLLCATGSLYLVGELLTVSTFSRSHVTGRHVRP